MKRHTLLAAAVACLIAGNAFAQSTSPNVSLSDSPPNPGEDRSALIRNGNESNNDLATLRARIDELERRLQRQATATPTPDPGQSQEIRELASRIDNLERQVDSLKTELNSLARSSNALYGMIDEVRQSSGSLQIFGKMQTDPNFRQEMQRVVQGKIIFNNYTGVEQPVLINGNRWRVPPGTSHLMVPYGVVYAQLPWEPTKTWDNWRIVGNEQQMTINIGY